MIRIKAPQDFGAAVLFLVIGGAGLWFGRDYAVGSVARIGPGYVPALMGWGLLIVGAILAVRSLAFDGPRIDAGSWRPRLVILAAVLAFAGLIEVTGLFIASAVALGISGFATPEVRKKEIVLLALLFSAFCAMLFVYGLNQPVAIFGARA